jgi:hypothetical protein
MMIESSQAYSFDISRTAIRSSTSSAIVLFICLFLSMSFFQPVEAGIFSNLIKNVSKLSKKIDIDSIPFKKLDIDLPDNHKAYVISATPDSNGNWQLRTLDDLPVFIRGKSNFRKKLSDTEHPLIIINEYKLPKSLKSFDNLPDDIPIYIRKGDNYFKISRSDGWRISSNNVGLKISSINDLKNGLWHMRRPWSSQPINIINLKISGRQKTRHPNENVTINEVNIDELIQNIKKFRYQTIVIPGTITKTSLSLAGKNKRSVSLNKLKEAAEKYDINLVLLNAKNQSSVRQLNKQLENNFSGNLIYDNTNDFFRRLSDGQRQIDVSINRSGNSQTLIEARIPERMSDKISRAGELAPVNSGLTELSTHILLTSVKIIRPNRERSGELDSRIFPAVHSYITNYLIISIVLGLLVHIFCLIVWNKIWPQRTAESFKNRFFYYLYSLFYYTLFIVLFIPLFGAVCCIAFSIHTLYKFIKGLLIILKNIVVFLFIKPVKTIYKFIRQA